MYPSEHWYAKTFAKQEELLYNSFLWYGAAYFKHMFQFHLAILKVSISCFLHFLFLFDPARTKLWLSTNKRHFCPEIQKLAIHDSDQFITTWAFFRNFFTCLYIGPSGVRALPLGVAAKRSVHYIWYYFFSIFFFSVPHTFLPEGVVLGLWNTNNKIRGKTKFLGPPPRPLGGTFLVFFFLCAWEAHAHVRVGPSWAQHNCYWIN